MVECGALEEKSHRKVAAQGYRKIAHRDAIGTFLDLSNDTGPSSQGEQLGSQIVRPFHSGHAELR
jgi:hypothetical protein